MSALKTANILGKKYGIVVFQKKRGKVGRCYWVCAAKFKVYLVVCIKSEISAGCINVYERLRAVPGAKFE